MLRRYSLRAQLFALVAATLLPPVFYGVVSIRQQAAEFRREAEADALALARQITARLDDHILNVESLLVAAGQAVAGNLSAVAANDARLRNIHAELPAYFGSISVLTPQGRMLNSATVAPQERRAIDFSDRTYFREAIAKRGIAVGEPIQSRTTGKWIVILARPLFGIAGEVRAVVSISTQLELFQSLLAPERLPPGTVLTLISEKGQVLARSKDPAAWIGRNISGTGRVGQALREREGTWESVAADGVARLAGFSTGRRVPWLAYVGIPLETALAREKAAVQTQVLLVVASLLIASALAWLAARRIAGPVRSLTATVRAISEGNSGARAPEAGATEVIEMAREFNRMLDSVRRGEASEERFRKVFAGSSVPMSITADSGRLLDVNDAFCRYFGYAREEMLGRTTVEMGLWADPAERERIMRRLRASGSVRGMETRRRLRSGEERNVVVNVDLLELGGEPCTLAILIDVTEQRRAERERTKALERFETIFHAAPLASAISTLAEGRVVEVNAAYCALVGRGREELIGRRVTELYVWADPDERDAFIERLRRERRIEGFEAHVRSEDAGPRTVLTSAELIEFLDEPCLLMVGADITDRLRAMEALRQSEARYQLAVSSGDVWDIDIRTGSGQMSSNFKHHLGYEEAEIEDTMEALDALLHPEDRPRLKQAVRDHFRNRTPYRLEFRARAKSGDYRWFVTRGRAQRDESGAPVYMAGTTFDITEQKRAEQALRELIDNLFSFVGVLTPAGLLVEANQTALRAADLRAEEVLGKAVEGSPWVAFSEDSRSRMRAAVRRAAAGEPVRQDLEIRVAQGRIVTIDFALMPVRDASGHVAKLVASGIDITERKRAEEALREANTRLQALSARLLEVQEQERAAIALELHDEIGQSLTALKLGAQALARDADGGNAERLAQQVAIADQALAQTRNLVLDLRPPQLDQLGLAATLRDYAMRIAGGAGLKPVFSVDGDYRSLDRRLATTAFRVAQEALTNIARHAKARNVAVELRKQGNELLLAVSDDGCGYDLPEARRRATRGGSVGILGMEERVALAGGTLRIVTRPGQGTRVQANLPMASFAARETARPAG